MGPLAVQFHRDIVLLHHNNNGTVTSACIWGEETHNCVPVIFQDKFTKIKKYGW
jgi:hypothetical protein